MEVFAEYIDRIVKISNVRFAIATNNDAFRLLLFILTIEN